MNRDGILGVLKALGCRERDISKYARQEVAVRCPLAQWRHKKKRDGSPSMSIRINDKGPSPWHCFSCKSKGTSLEQLVGAIQKHDHTRNLRPLQMKVLLAEEVDLGDSLDNLGEYAAPPEPESTAPEFWDERFLRGFYEKVHRTVPARGVTRASWRRWEVGYDERRGRVVFPLRDVMGRLQGVSGRAVDGRMPKYLNYVWSRFGDKWKLTAGIPRDPEPDEIARFPKSDHLFGAHLFPSNAAAIGILVEGQFDTVMVDQLLRTYGLQSWFGVVGYSGNRVTPEQAQILADLCDEVIIMHDNDDPGLQARDLCEKALAAKGLIVHRFTYPEGCDGMDPDDLIRQHPTTALERLLQARKL